MDLFPLWNSLRVAAISTVIVFFAGIFAAYYIARLPRLVKGVLDVVLTLPLVLPPTVIGYLLLRLLGPKRILGAWLLQSFRREGGDDVVVRHLCHRGGDLPADVPHRPRSLRIL